MFKLIAASLGLAFVFALASANIGDAGPQDKPAKFAQGAGAADKLARY
ncbi:MAG: hypothetical protein ACK4MV_08610 [Beijerinckiaceae bacterium]